LKLKYDNNIIVYPHILSEQHPREQGLKPYLPQVGTQLQLAFRATSKRTRIETQLRVCHRVPAGGFQSNIQENKD